MKEIQKLDDRIKAILPYENKWYKLVPEVSHDCVGCAFENCECCTMPNFCYLCDLGGIWEEIKDEQAITNCNQLKMREALLMVKKLFDDKIMFQHDIRKAHKAVNDALSAPPLYETEDEAYQAYLKEMEGTPENKKVFFESWLFAKLKGGEK